MTWDEFCSLLTGLSGDSPLGRIVQIRSETDKNVLKHFTSHQRKIRSDWQLRKAKSVSSESLDAFLKDMTMGFKLMAETEK